jgi:hypothetical protein
MDWKQTMRGARYHEAGHAVAAYQHMYTIKGVTATEEEWRADYRVPAYAKMLGDDADVTLAGSFADMLAMWGEIRPVPWEECLEVAQMQREGELERGDQLDLLETLETRCAPVGPGRRRREAVGGAFFSGGALQRNCGMDAETGLRVLAGDRGRCPRPGTQRIPRRAGGCGDHRARRLSPDPCTFPARSFLSRGCACTSERGANFA